MKKYCLYILLLSGFIISCSGQSETGFAKVDFETKRIAAGQTKTIASGFKPFAIEIQSKITPYGPKTEVRCALQDKIGNLWFCTWEGIYRYDGKYFTVFTEKNVDPFSGGVSVLNRVYSILEDRAGNIWFGTEDGVYRYDGKTFTGFPIPDADIGDVNWINMSTKSIISLYQDKKGNLWFGSNGGGAYRYDGTLLTNFTIEGDYRNNLIQGILEDNEGNLWFASRGGGPRRYDDKSITAFVAKEIPYNHLSNIYKDKKGDLWFGTVNAGVVRYDGKSFSRLNNKEGNVRGVFMEDSKGKLWLATLDGVCSYDGKTFTDFSAKEGLCNNSVWTILEDRSGNLWFGTKGGICRYDGKSFTDFTEKEAKK